MSSIYQLMTGAVGGLTVQFSDSAWPAFGQTVSLDEGAAFEWVRPLLEVAVPSWQADHWYARYEFEVSETKALIAALASKSDELARDLAALPQATMLADLAKWLQERTDGPGKVTFYGI